MGYSFAVQGADRDVWVFDVDGCLVDSLTGTSLRPDAVDLLSYLRRRGCAIHLWSAGGADYARTRATRHGIQHHFTGFHDKARRDTDGRYVPEFLQEPDQEVKGAGGAGDRAGDGVAPGAVFVDDRPEDMPLGAEVVAVSPYIAANPHDRGLQPALARARVLLASGGDAYQRSTCPQK
jgi:long-chain acyl-CoA synthetase